MLVGVGKGKGRVAHLIILTEQGHSKVFGRDLHDFGYFSFLEHYNSFAIFAAGLNFMVFYLIFQSCQWGNFQRAEGSI